MIMKNQTKEPYIPQIEVNDLKVAYDNNIIIDQMNLAIPKGKITMIIGSNGCGKSTLLKTIARINRPSAGDIIINGKSIKEKAPKEIAKEMAVLPQSPKAPSGLMIRELVAYGRFPYQGSMSGMSEHDYEVVDWALKVTNLTEFANRLVKDVSGGQRQRAWIAMALAQETNILVLDEPTTYLDMSHQLEILLLLQKLNKEEKRTIVMVLHELNNATRFADHIIGVKSGKIVFEGHPKDVITEENLETLYGIKAKLQLDESQSYPICVDFDLVPKN